MAKKTSTPPISAKEIKRFTPATVILATIVSSVVLYVLYLVIGIFIFFAQMTIPSLREGLLINAILLVEWAMMIYLNVRIETHFFSSQKVAIVGTAGALLIFVALFLVASAGMSAS